MKKLGFDYVTISAEEDIIKLLMERDLSMEDLKRALAEKYPFIAVRVALSNLIRRGIVIKVLKNDSKRFHFTLSAKCLQR